MRRAGNLAEALLWLQLKGRQLKGYDFHRQKPLGKYIVDFYCPDLMLAIEIDGTTHNGNDAEEADRERQTELESLGIHVMRFLDSDVRQNMNGVITAIGEWIEQRR